MKSRISSIEYSGAYILLSITENGKQVAEKFREIDEIMGE